MPPGHKPRRGFALVVCRHRHAVARLAVRKISLMEAKFRPVTELLRGRVRYVAFRRLVRMSDSAK